MKKLAILLALVAVQAEAKMCEAVATNGIKVYLFVGTPTKSASGEVATMAKCAPELVLELPAQTIKGVRLEAKNITSVTIPKPEATNPVEIQAECMRTLSTVCDPQYGGIKLYTNPSVKNGVIEANCVGVTIKSGQPEDSNEVYYAYPAMYSGLNADGTCRFDK